MDDSRGSPTGVPVQITRNNMRYEVNIVKAFKDKNIPTLGNPAGVLVVEKMPSPEDMKQVAVQAKQPMTAFVCPRDDGGKNFDVRYYDLGGRECHICGHATIAATAQLVREKPELKGQDFSFHLNPSYFNGEDKTLVTHVRGDEISIDLFPSILRQEHDEKLYRKVASVLGIRREDIDAIAFSTNVRDYVVALKDPDVILDMKPDFKAMKEMAEQAPFQHEGLMVSSLAPKDAGCDLYVRVFLPITGVNEDIACGSGNCSIVPFWHDRGLNQDTRTYKAIFPYPEGPKGYLGGIQKIEYSPSQNRITIASDTEFEKTEVIVLPSARLIHGGNDCGLADGA